MQINDLTIKLDNVANVDLRQALKLCGLTVEKDAKINCPVDTGTLRNSITSFLISDDTVQVGSNLDYAIYVENGTGLFAINGDGRKDVPWVYRDAEGNFHSTSGQEPKQFLHTALNDNKEQVIDILKQAVKEAMK